MAETNPKHSASPAKELVRRLKIKGHKAQIVPIKRLSDLEQKTTQWHETNHLNKDFYEEHLKDFVFAPPVDFPGVKSTIVVASPQPNRQVSFSLNSKTDTAVIPYQYSYETDAEVATILDDWGTSLDIRFAKAALPLKLLAVCSGLAVYGKNNIAYIEGMGSYFRLSAFYSDLPADTDIWVEPRMLERCRNCRSCIKNCPTQAIRSDRFLISAEHCITFHNESKKDFPDWIVPSWHKNLVGCLICQQNCPENRNNKGRTEKGWIFSAEETTLIMKQEPVEKLPEATAKKLERLGMLTYYDILPRNLRALLTGRDLSPDEGSS